MQAFFYFLSQIMFYHVICKPNYIHFFDAFFYYKILKIQFKYNTHCTYVKKWIFNIPFGLRLIISVFFVTLHIIYKISN